MVGSQGCYKESRSSLFVQPFPESPHLRLFFGLEAYLLHLIDSEGYHLSANMALPNVPLTPEQLQGLLNGPAEKPPAGTLPDFDDPSNMNHVQTVTLTLCISIATIALFLRMYTKVFLICKIAYEDCE